MQQPTLEAPSPHVAAEQLEQVNRRARVRRRRLRLVRRGMLLLVPVALLVTGGSMANNLAALVVVYVSTRLPVGLCLLRSYFLGIALDLEHAAMIDGATRLQAFYLVVLPQAVPDLITTAIFTFNE